MILNFEMAFRKMTKKMLAHNLDPLHFKFEQAQLILHVTLTGEVMHGNNTPYTVICKFVSCTLLSTKMCLF